KGWHGSTANAHDDIAEDITPVMATTIGPGFGQVGRPDTLAPVVLQPIQRLLAIATPSAAVTRNAVEGAPFEMFLAFGNTGRRGRNLTAKIQRRPRFFFLSYLR